MKLKQKLLASVLATSALWGAASSQVVAADVGASVAVANMYYWRGLDLGFGDPALIADVNVSSSGFYAGIWASSGDAILGTEYDFYAGYGFDVGAVSVDLNYTTYMYPSVPTGDNAGFDDVADVAITVGYAPTDDLSFSVMYREGMGESLKDDNYSYATVGGSYKKISALVGTHADDSGTYDSLTHLDVTYAYSDKLAFTLGKVIDEGESNWNDELKFIVKLELPIL